ncbi:MAG: DUF4918 family protein [Bacteroidota bacterium]|nr:DUF4918 family protein [Bacteroidota bacterium]
MQKTFADKLISFYRTLEFKEDLPKGIDIMNPYQEKSIMEMTALFAKRFYNDTSERISVFGINPGRFGSGLTGITFTDPVRMEKECGIENNLRKKQELSSVFIYDMINRFGGPEKFYKKFFLSAVSPLGFLKNGKNLNYYDNKALETLVTPFIIESIRKSFSIGCSSGIIICLGEGKNYTFLTRLNEKYGFYEKIIPLAHPRFIMQYRLKKKEEYIIRYLEVLNDSLNFVSLPG